MPSKSLNLVGANLFNNSGEKLKADDDKEYKILRYEEMIPYLVEAIKEQQKQINKLEEKLNG